MNRDTMKQKVYELSGEEKQRILKQITTFMGRHKEVLFAYVYGSFTEDIPFHDIDVGIYVSGIRQEKASVYALELQHKLDKELKIGTDVRVMNFAPVSFIYSVIRGCLVSERDENKRAQVLEDAVRRYLDIKPLLYRGIKEAFAA